ncbi:hypothetical protein P4647_25520 [Peribacillus frigoritolerans]|uniref:hypothetical protein n=1 Tax=Peribacillus frigoritolerans TaxID=450367 RepID=UPI002E1A1B7E|nr:hypothetical protein [Peribacillus frigoritolerans]
MCNNNDTQNQHTQLIGTGSSLGFKLCNVKMLWPENLPCPDQISFIGNAPNEPGFSTDTQPSVSRVDSTIPHFVNYGLIDFDVTYENGVVNFIVSIAGAEIGRATLTASGSCVVLKGKADVFGAASANVELKVCAYLDTRKICASGEAYIKVFGQKVPIGSFSECASF